MGLGLDRLAWSGGGGGGDGIVPSLASHERRSPAHAYTRAPRTIFPTHWLLGHATGIWLLSHATFLLFTFLLFTFLRVAFFIAAFFCYCFLDRPRSASLSGGRCGFWCWCWRWCCLTLGRVDEVRRSLPTALARLMVVVVIRSVVRIMVDGPIRRCRRRGACRRGARARHVRGGEPLRRGIDSWRRRRGISCGTLLLLLLLRARC